MNEQQLREEIRTIDRMLKAMVGTKIKFARCSLVAEDENPKADQYKNRKMELYYHQVDVSPRLVWKALTQQKRYLQSKLKEEQTRQLQSKLKE